MFLFMFIVLCVVIGITLTLLVLSNVRGWARKRVSLILGAYLLSLLIIMGLMVYYIASDGLLKGKENKKVIVREGEVEIFQSNALFVEYVWDKTMLHMMDIQELKGRVEELKEEVRELKEGKR